MLNLLWLSVAMADGWILLALEAGAPPPEGAEPVFAPAPRAAPEAFMELGLDRVWRLAVAGDPAAAAAQWSAVEGVAFAEVDGVGGPVGAPSDPQYSLQWGLSNDGSFSSAAAAGADIQAEDAWKLTTGTGVLIAVLDSGLNTDEIDISRRVWSNTAESEDGNDTDGNGYVDDVEGWDFAAGGPEIYDGTGHGSNVTGIAAAEGDNGVGYAGVCWACEVMPLKVLNDSDYGYYSWWAEAVVYAADNGADVANMSLGGTSSSLVLCLGLSYAEAAGMPVVVSMGNGASDTPYYPAACESAIAVGATDEADQYAQSFCWGGGSSYGDHIDISAPGESIFGLSIRSGIYTDYWCGTSQAAPHVTGTIALLYSLAADLSVDEVRSYLEDGAEDEVGRASEDVAGWDVYHGAGRLNAYQSLSLLSADLTDADGDGFTARDGDCDEGDPAVYPEALESCDFTDSDCDGSLTDGYTDTDGDGQPDCIGDADGDGQSPAEGDCDDTDPAVSTAAAESPYDGIDNDCDPDTPDDDLDSDGHGIDTDCDDTDAAAAPGRAEVCDGIDNDCDGETDEDPVDGDIYYTDADGDGYGDAPVLACGGEGLAAEGGDCDDTDPTASPQSTWYPDLDGDGLGDGAYALTSCDAPAGYVAEAGDCNDDRDGARCGGCTTAAGPGVLGWLLMLPLVTRRRSRP